MRIAVWLKMATFILASAVVAFQSAVRIAVWLKDILGFRPDAKVSVSIRRADRCLVEDGQCPVSPWHIQFQSAVRIAVWLKLRPSAPSVAGSRCFNPPCGSLFG